MCIAPDLLTQRFATQALNVTPQLKMVSHRLVICGTEYVAVITSSEEEAYRKPKRIGLV